MPTADEDESLFDALDEIEHQLAEGNLGEARRALEIAQGIAGSADPDVIYAEAGIVWQENGASAAEPLLERVLAADPEHSDAHYALAEMAEDRGDEAAMIEHFLQVHALDARADRKARLGTPAQIDQIERVAREVLASLPSPFAEKLEPIPVVLERRPSRELVREGFDPRALGLFEGPTQAELGAPAPTRIVLFINNLLAEFPEDPELSEQIEVTVLHEVGHFFGLDEDDMVRLGLD